MVLLLVQLWESCQEEEKGGEAAPRRSRDASTQTGCSRSGKVMIAATAAGKEEDADAGRGGAFAVFEYLSKVCLAPTDCNVSCNNQSMGMELSTSDQQHPTNGVPKTKESTALNEAEYTSTHRHDLLLYVNTCALRKSASIWIKINLRLAHQVHRSAIQVRAISSACPHLLQRPSVRSRMLRRGMQRLRLDAAPSVRLFTVSFCCRAGNIDEPAHQPSHRRIPADSTAAAAIKWEFDRRSPSARDLVLHEETSKKCFGSLLPTKQWQHDGMPTNQ